MNTPKGDQGQGGGGAGMCGQAQRGLNCFAQKWSRHFFFSFKYVKCFSSEHGKIYILVLKNEFSNTR